MVSTTAAGSAAVGGALPRAAIYAAAKADGNGACSSRPRGKGWAGCPRAPACSRSAARLQVLGASFEENTTQNIEIFNPRDTRSAADKATQGVPKGNVVELLLRNTMTVGLNTFMLRTPGDPSNRNIVIGSDVALSHSNDDVVIDGSFTWTGED